MTYKEACRSARAKKRLCTMLRDDLTAAQEEFARAIIEVNKAYDSERLILEKKEKKRRTPSGGY